MHALTEWFFWVWTMVLLLLLIYRTGKIMDKLGIEDTDNGKDEPAQGATEARTREP